MMYKRYIGVSILLNIHAYSFAPIGTFFIKTGYVCNYGNSAIILEITGVNFGLCALSCLEDDRCFSFQHNKQTQKCYTSTWNIYAVQTCASASDDNEIAYLKELSYTPCPPGFGFPFDGSCYFYPGKAVRRRYNDASQACIDMGANLVRIDSLEENNNVAAFVASQNDYAPDGNNYYWFGGMRVTGTGNPGTWKWQDGTDVTYSNWFGTEPDGDPHGMCMYGSVAGANPTLGWGDNSCTSHESYICEMRP